jgi:hypothetical protein
MSIADIFGIIVDRVYEKGVENTKLAVWNALTGNGTRTNGVRMFCETDFSDFTFPKTITITASAQHMFYNYKGSKLPRKEDISLAGLTISAATTTYIYGWCSNVEYVPDYGLPSAMSYAYAYQNCRNLKEIEMIRTGESTEYNNSFINCDSLTDITFDGEIGKNINFQYSPISAECMKHIISRLKKYSGAESGKYSIIFNDACWDALEADSNSPIGGKWKDYVIDHLGWDA